MGKGAPEISLQRRLICLAASGSRLLLAPHVKAVESGRSKIHVKAVESGDHGVLVKVTNTAGMACMALYTKGLESVISRAETKFSEVFPNTGAANCG